MKYKESEVILNEEQHNEMYTQLLKELRMMINDDLEKLFKEGDAWYRWNDERHLFYWQEASIQQFSHDQASNGKQGDCVFSAVLTACFFSFSYWCQR